MIGTTIGLWATGTASGDNAAPWRSGQPQGGALASEMKDGAPFVFGWLDSLVLCAHVYPRIIIARASACRLAEGDRGAPSISTVYC